MRVVIVSVILISNDKVYLVIQLFLFLDVIYSLNNLLITNLGFQFDITFCSEGARISAHPRIPSTSHELSLLIITKIIRLAAKKSNTISRRVIGNYLDIAKNRKIVWVIQ